MAHTPIKSLNKDGQQFHQFQQSEKYIYPQIIEHTSRQRDMVLEIHVEACVMMYPNQKTLSNKQNQQ